jgi:hypothetical protein
MAVMLQTQLEIVVANMEDEVAIKVDELVLETKEELTSMALMFWT